MARAGCCCRKCLESLRLWKKKIVLLGQLNKFEIWNEDAWAAKESKWMVGNDTEGLEKLGPLSF
jgi:MraZ protein